MLARCELASASVLAQHCLGPGRGEPTFISCSARDSLAARCNKVHRRPHRLYLRRCLLGERIQSRDSAAQTIFDPIPHCGISASAKGVPEPLSQSHVFSAQLSPDGRSPPGRTLLHESAQNSLLQLLPTNDRSRTKPVLSHFANFTVPTICSSPRSSASWRETIPVIAAHHPYVLHGVLAVGALHLSTITNVASEKEDYQNLAATQMNMELAQYREDVQNVSTTNAEALFAFSTMFTIFVHSTSKTERLDTFKLLNRTDISAESHQRLVLDLTQGICRIFRSIRGVLLILVPCWHHIRNGSLGPVVERDWWPSRVPVTTEEFEHDQRLQNLEKMWAHPGRSYEYFFDTLARALKILRETSTLVSRLATLTSPGQSLSHEDFDWTSIVPWITEIPFEFITLLEQQRMEAWVLMAHYALLPSKIQSSWWLDGWAIDMFITSALAIGEENWDWISWPAAVLEIDLDGLRMQHALD
ncbi:hypothetical protein DE146DRAFT_630189 [Phaeosphaeria sp. MPI-PUGE-AT-0046c]|nr:hypothetical protein DE146DRAFT_630189 [Phaeosphaeria sp. MPI-PUGE-AT-0046c]